jgi:hypothetical protein
VKDGRQRNDSRLREVDEADLDLRLEQQLAVRELDTLEIWLERLDFRWGERSEQAIARLAHREPVPSPSNPLVSGQRDRRPADDVRLDDIIGAYEPAPCTSSGTVGSVIVGTCPDGLVGTVLARLRRLTVRSFEHILRIHESR